MGLCGALTCALCLAVPGADERASEPAPVEVLPADCVFVASVDFKALGGSLVLTPFGKFLAQPESQLFLEPVLREAGAVLEDWRKRFPVLPSFAALSQLASGQAALGLRLVPSGQPLIPPRTVPLAVFRIKDPGAVSHAMMEVFHFMPEARLPSGAQARGGEGLWTMLEGRWLLLATTPEDLDGLRAALHKPQAEFGSGARWKKMQQELGAGCAAVAWADVQAAREHLLPLPADPNVRSALPPSPAKALAALGLDGVQAIAMGLGVAGPHLDFRMALEAPVGPRENRRGVLKLLEGGGNLHAGLLAQVPPQASWFYLTRLDPRRVLPLLMEGVEASSGDPLETFKLKVALRGLAILADLDLERDLIGNLGTDWLLCDAPAALLPEALPGMAITGSVRDPEKLDRALEKLFAFLVREAPQHLGVRSGTLSEADTSVYYLRLPLTDLSPAAAVVGRQVVFSPTLAGLRSQVRHLRQLGPAGLAQDIRGQPAFQGAYRAAFGRDLPRPPAQGAEEESLPSSLRYLDPARARPTKFIGTLAGAVKLMGPSILDLLQAQTGLRRARLKAILHLLAEGLRNTRQAHASASKKGLPHQLRELLLAADGGVAAGVDLEGVHYRTGLSLDDPGETILAYASLEPSRESPCGILRLAGTVETLAPAALWKEWNAQREVLRARQREVRDEEGPSAPGGRPGSWWSSIWEQQAHERMLLLQDALRLAGRVDFARLPDLRAWEAELPAGISWTRTNEWGMVSRTLTAFPLPALDLAGAGVPLAWGALALPEMQKAQRANHELLIRADLQALSAAQWFYRMVDWDGDRVRSYAPTLQELGVQGLIGAQIAGAEARPGAQSIPRHGYFFRMLAAQGKHAQGGEKSYSVAGKWTGGYALLAWPAAYGKSGRKTFMAGPEGTLFEADLFWVTQGTAEQVTVFDPDPERGWRQKE